MNPVRVVLLCCLALLCAVPSSAQARSKPGPTTIRGVASHVTSTGFKLTTVHHGSYSVAVQRATAIDEKGVRGRAILHDGDHVGVRGYVHGRQITAIHVRVYPTKAKPVSINGTVRAVHGQEIEVVSGGRVVRVTTSRATAFRGADIAHATTGQKIHVRATSSARGYTATLVHLYVTSAHGQSVLLKGSLSAVSAGGLVVVSGSVRTSVSVTGATRVFVGREHGGPRDLRTGETVSVYACCAGGRLTATSIHIRKTPTATHAVEYRGTVLSVGPNRLVVRTGSATMTVLVSSQTAISVGTSSASLRAVYVGDQVTVRAGKSGGSVVATRVHVLQASRKPRDVSGTVAGISPTAITIDSGSTRTVVALGSGTRATAGNRPISLSAVRPGEHVRVRAVRNAAGRLTATRLRVRLPRVAHIHISGTVLSLQGKTLTVQSDTGSRVTVQLTAGTRVTARKRPADISLLFPGARVAIRGTGSTAVSVNVSAEPAHVQGKVVQRGAGWIEVQGRSGATVRVDLPGEVAVRDGGQRVASSTVAPGAQVRVKGYLVSRGRLRATAVRVLHPSVTMRGALVRSGAGMFIFATDGTRRLLIAAPGVKVSVAHLDTPLSLAEIPGGAHVTASGTLDAHGGLVATSIRVRLKLQHLEGKIGSVRTSSLTLQGEDRLVRLSAATTIRQGSHALALADLVAGDAVTIDGYGLVSGLLARHIVVHRHLITLDGTVTQSNPTGFVIQSADGAHTVILSPTTTVTGIAGAVSVGLKVHVSGYLRGDGSILAIRIKALKSR